MVQMKIILRGVVEGTGIRPALFRHSIRHGLHGYVVNYEDHVELLWQGAESVVNAARKELRSMLPEDCRLENVSADSADAAYPDFSFHHAPRSRYSLNLAAPPDQVPCADCLAEIRDPENRRHRHAFNACAVCGPRTTVMHALPYDRENTAWAPFPLCGRCRAEYDDPEDRRFHIQGISCPDCGPHLRLLSAARKPVDTPDPVSSAAAILKEGKLLALKGVGGFQLLCDAFASDAVARLRICKNRPEKPLALMANSMASLRRFFRCPEEEEALVTSPAGPAVLLEWKTEPARGIAPDTPDTAAVMLPSSPLHHLLLEDIPLVVATSCNRSGEPPAMTEEEIFPGADFILTHDREILRRNDDSVCAIFGTHRQIWRRARGFSPTLRRNFRRRILALGAGMKNTFAESDRDRFFLSSHFGELEDPASWNAWRRAVQQCAADFPEPPDEIVCDLHPDYPSSRFAQELADEFSIPLRRAPHHAAHALAALLDSGLRRALVFVFDGTGLGADGVFRGSELFEMDLDGICRHAACWNSVPLPGGDHAVRHPYRQLAARRITAGAEGPFPHVSPEHLEILKLQCSGKLAAPRTCGAGRLFDSVAALCGIAPETVSYDGQSAVRLEYAARKDSGKAVCPVPDYSEDKNVMTVDWTSLFRAGAPVSTPRGFHEAAARSMVRMAAFARETSSVPTENVLFSGGVFQNRLLLRMAMEYLENKGFRCCLPSELPPGDGSISAGQLLWGEYRMKTCGANDFAGGTD